MHEGSYRGLLNARGVVLRPTQCTRGCIKAYSMHEGSYLSQSLLNVKQVRDERIGQRQFVAVSIQLPLHRDVDGDARQRPQ